MQVDWCNVDFEEIFDEWDHKELAGVEAHGNLNYDFHGVKETTYVTDEV